MTSGADERVADDGAELAEVLDVASDDEHRAPRQVGGIGACAMPLQRVAVFTEKGNSIQLAVILDDSPAWCRDCRRGGCPSGVARR